MARQRGAPTADAVDRGRQRIAEFVNRRMPLTEFFAAVDSTLRTLIPYDAPCWMSCDPATLLPTAHYSPGYASVLQRTLIRDEYLEDDVNKHLGLARAPRQTPTLRQATRAVPDLSARLQSAFQPIGHGDGDELRALLRAAGTAWGCVILHRGSGTFTRDDIGLVESLAPLFAEGIRRSILESRPIHEGTEPGLIVLTPDDAVEAITAPARAWLAAMIDDAVWTQELPLAVLGLAERARLVAAGLDVAPATARLPLRGGSWIVAHAVVLEGAIDAGRIAITLSPVGQNELSSIIVDAYGLSPREREITRLVLTGLATNDLAVRLGISPYTVQDHLKSIFDKVGVRSRRQLVAEIFFRQYAPRLDVDTVNAATAPELQPL